MIWVVDRFAGAMIVLDRLFQGLDFVAFLHFTQMWLIVVWPSAALFQSTFNICSACLQPAKLKNKTNGRYCRQNNTKDAHKESDVFSGEIISVTHPIQRQL